MTASLVTFCALVLARLSSTVLAADSPNCSASRLHLSDPPYQNYLFSDCNSASHVIVTSPTSSDKLTQISPRLLIAWPAGNSGIAAYFVPQNGQNGTLGISLENSTSSGEALESVSLPGGSENPNPRVGVSGLIHFDSPAVLTLPILGSIRTIRDFSEGSSTLVPDVQNAVQIQKYGDSGASIYRTWFDNTTTTWLDFTPTGYGASVQINSGAKYTLSFATGTYEFRATFDYPQMEQLSPQEVLNSAASSLISQNPDQTTSLSFLSYTSKLLAGTWRFLTYFGRDTMISAILMQSILSEGQGGATEAVIGAAIERINRTDGTVCHEEVIGDYATYLSRQTGAASTAPSCDYKMIDTDYYLPIIMKSYFVDSSIGKGRASAFLATKASFLEENSGIAYSDLAQLTAEKIMRTSAPFASAQTIDNLIHLRPDQPVGEWRDSNNGLGGGRIPYDVNTALVPASLRAIAALSNAGFFPGHSDWKDTANQYAQVWEDTSLQFFHVSVSQSDAQTRVQAYVSQSNFTGPSNTNNITGEISYYGLALGGNNNQQVIPVMNTDDCFRHFLLNTTNQTQLSAYLSQTADHILQPFPVGLSSDVGLFVANPAYSGDAAVDDNFTNADYHGTVVWSWQLAMMAAGLARQLDRCRSGDKPDFCNDSTLATKVSNAYTHLWDLIDKNSAQLSGEVWSWKYDNGFQVVPFSAVSSTESDIRQLWSLTFLAIHRENF